MKASHRRWLLGLVLVGGCAVYPRAKLAWSERQADTLCAETVPGTTVARFREHAEDLGLECQCTPLRIEPEKPETIHAWEGWVFARALCIAEIEDGVVSATRRCNID